jgi:hypothetical protein
MLEMLIWLLGWVPAVFFYIVGGAGLAAILASWFISIIPLINSYRFQVQAIGVALLGFGAFFSGGVGVNEVWKARVAEMEAKVAEAESKSHEANTQIQTVYVDRIRLVHDTETKIVTQIKEVEKIIDAECKVDEKAIDLLNRASLDPTPSKENK